MKCLVDTTTTTAAKDESAAYFTQVNLESTLTRSWLSSNLLATLTSVRGWESSREEVTFVRLTAAELTHIKGK